MAFLELRGQELGGKDAMFLKRLERRKNGKGHTYWALERMGGVVRRVLSAADHLDAHRSGDAVEAVYIQLTEAEWAFRIQKDELEIRPIWHQKQDRIQAHILVCFLADALWKALAQRMRCAGLGDAPRTVLEEFAKIKSGDVLLRTQAADGRPGKTVRVRCVTTPDAAQRVLLNRLGLILPQRLRHLEEVDRM